MKNLLRFDGLHLKVGSRTILHDISFSIAEGEVVGLIGQSGAGKTSLALAALGQLPARYQVTEGAVWLEGQNLYQMNGADRRAFIAQKVAYVPQSALAAFNPGRRLGSQIIEGVVKHKKWNKSRAMKKCRELFRRLNLSHDLLERFPHQLSGGQLQRAMMAMALLPEPRLIIFDEPTSALDVSTQLESLILIKQLLEEYRIGALYISHDLPLAVQMAQRLIVLRGSLIEEEGTSEEIIRCPTQQYTRNLIAASKLTSMVDKTQRDASLLKIERLSAGYSANPFIIKNVFLDICEGETFGIVGQSGSGKTTLARAIAGLIPVGKGDIQMRERHLSISIANRTKEERRVIQYVAQHPDQALNPGHDVLTIIGRPLRFFFGLHGKDLIDQALELLEQMGLDSSYLKRYPHELSGGQIQRIGIARALAARPALLICDEITSALDPLSSAEIMNLLERFQKQNGITYIFISHDLRLVERSSRRVAIMREGRIVAQGETLRVLRQSEDKDIINWMGSIPELRMDWLESRINFSINFP